MPTDEEMAALSKIIDIATEEFQNTKDDETLDGNLLKWYLKRHHYL